MKGSLVEQSQSQAYPQSPDGYQTPELFQYPTIKLQLAAIGILVVSTPLLIIFTLIMQNLTGWNIFLFSGKLIDFVIVLATILSTLILHELVHGTIYRMLGYQVRYGISPRHLAAYAGVFEQWQKRDHNIIAALSPLFVLTAIFLPLLAIPNRIIVLVAFTVLLVNTAGAVGDIYLTWRLLRMPRTTLGYDIDLSTMLVYKPVDS
jgi:hypothetical protein